MSDGMSEHRKKDPISECMDQLYATTWKKQVGSLIIETKVNRDGSQEKTYKRKCSRCSHIYPDNIIFTCPECFFKEVD